MIKTETTIISKVKGSKLSKVMLEIINQTIIKNMIDVINIRIEIKIIIKDTMNSTEVKMIN